MYVVFLHISSENECASYMRPGARGTRFQEDLQYKGLRSMLAIRGSLAGLSALWFGKLIMFLDRHQNLPDVASSVT